jgi:hypothetical protein
VAAVAILSLFSVILGGCDMTETSNGDSPPWDPCSAFPESVMQQLGYDYMSNVRSPGEKCGWVNSKTGYGPVVQYVTKAEIDDWRSNTVDLTEVTIGQYSGYRYRYRSESVDPLFACTVRLETKNSNVVFRVVNQSLRNEDPCPIVAEVATALAEYLPPAG